MPIGSDSGRGARKMGEPPNWWERADWARLSRAIRSDVSPAEA